MSHTDADAIFAHDDYPIAALPETALWSENYAFTCFDPAQGIAFASFLGRWWADPTLWREVVSVALPGGRQLCAKGYGRAATAQLASAAMFRVEIIEPGRRFRLTYDGPAWEQSRESLLRDGFVESRARRLRLRLDFDGVTPVWNMSGHADRSTEVAGKLHVEQVGIGKGLIQFGDERFDIAGAFMNRDHSRGPRDMSPFRRHCWAQGWFADERVSFNVYAIELFGIDGLAMSNATISKGDRRYPAKLVDIELIRGEHDARQPYRVVLASELGEMRLLRREALSSSPISFTTPWDLYHGVTPEMPSALTFEEASSWEWDDCIGLGWSERAFIETPFARGLP